jgi:hypothetical protein
VAHGDRDARDEPGVLQLETEPGRLAPEHSPPRRLPWARRLPHYALVTDDGDALGPIELDGTGADWPNGSVIEREGEPDLCVVGCMGSDDPETFAVLMVEPMQWPEVIVIAVVAGVHRRQQQIGKVSDVTDVCEFWSSNSGGWSPSDTTDGPQRSGSSPDVRINSRSPSFRVSK